MADQESAFCLYRFASFRRFMQTGSRSMTALFHSPQCFPDSSVLQQVSVFHRVLLPYCMDIPRYVGPSTRDGLLGWSHIFPIVNNAISIIYVRTSFCGMQHASSIYLEVELLNHVVIIDLVYGGAARPVSKVAPLFCIQPQCLRALVSPYPYQCLLIVSVLL